MLTNSKIIFREQEFLSHWKSHEVNKDKTDDQNGPIVEIIGEIQQVASEDKARKKEKKMKKDHNCHYCNKSFVSHSLLSVHIRVRTEFGCSSNLLHNLH